MMVGATKVPFAVSDGSGKRSNRATGGAHALHMRLNDALRLRRYDRADVGIDPVRATDGKLLQRALEHTERAVGHILLNAQDAQCRAALASAIEGGGNDVENHLFGKSGGIDDHGVLTAGFGNQRNGLARSRDAAPPAFSG